MNVLAIAAGMVATGVVYQLIGTVRQRKAYAPPGGLVDVGGHRLHVFCVGNGSPPVVFESGIAASSLSWALVQTTVGQFARACAYDRAGLAWSDAPSCPRSFDRIVDEFGAVVAHAAADERCVLVGHSFGTFVVRAYANRYPDRVAGLVLVDPPTEWLTMTRERARLIWGAQRLSKVGAVLAHLGVVRACLGLLSGGAPAAPRGFVKVFGPTAARTLERLVGEVRKLPPSVHPIVQAHWCQPKCFHAMAEYLRALADEGPSIAALAPSPAIPVVVISSGNQPPDQIAEHGALAERAARGRHVVAQRSGHWVQFDEPDLVIETIRDLVVGARGRPA